MKPLILALTFITSISCFAQERTNSTEPQKNDFTIGILANRIINPSVTPHFYSFNNGPIAKISEEDVDGIFVSNLYELVATYNFKKSYFTGSLGLGTDKVNTSIRTGSYNSYDSGPSGSYYMSSSGAERVYIKEKYTSVFGSLGVGIHLIQSSKLFKLTVGIGIDFTSYVSSSIDQNELIASGNSSGSNPMGSYSSSYSITYDAESPAWNNTITKHDSPLISPYIALQFSWQFSNHFSLITRAKIRQSNSLDKTKYDRGFAQFPIGFGINYRF